MGDDVRKPRIHHTALKVGITRTPEFEKKRLASFSVNVGTKCGHDCLYCSTGAVLRCHPSFKQAGENPFGHGYAIVDPNTPDRIARDAERSTKRGLVQLCSLTDAWSPEAREHDLGRRCLEAILPQPGWSVRILTKSGAVRKDFEFMMQYRDRVLVGLSLTAIPGKDHLINIIEPNASSISARLSALREAAQLGLRTYAMLCPLLPGIADLPEDIDELVQLVVSCNAEEIFVEPVNARGAGLLNCHDALELWGYHTEAKAIAKIRQREHWSRYVVELLRNVQRSVRRHSDISKLRFLLYPSRLLPEDRAEIEKDDEGVIWL